MFWQNAIRVGSNAVFELSAAALTVAVLATILIALDRHRRRGGPPALRVPADFAPTVAGILVAVSLVAAALERTLFAPTLLIPDGKLGMIAVVIELAAATLLALGLFARAAAAAMIVLFIAAAVWFRAAALQFLLIPGLGIFFLACGRGRLALGSVFNRIFFAMDSEHVRPVAIIILRIVFGVALIIFGLTKALRPDLYLGELEAYPTAHLFTYLKLLWPALAPGYYALTVAVFYVTAGILVFTGAFLRAVGVILFFAFLLLPLALRSPALPADLAYAAAAAIFIILDRRVA